MSEPDGRDGGSGLAAPATERRWARWLLPSFTDIFFLVFLAILTLTPASGVLLGDADTGWHIRDGELILASHRVPHTDPFSYTMAGHRWYAWEWLYDVAIAAIHHAAGLNGVVLFSAAVIAATFALLFRFLLRRSGNFAVASGFTLLAAVPAQIHILARPHILSWLFTLLWLEVLFQFEEEGRTRTLLCLPPLMLLWVNLHGGFLMGLVLIGLFLCAQIWRLLWLNDAASRGRIAQLAALLALCSCVTLLTPYGYQLHVHIYHYLTNGFLMHSINEFLSPDFHAPVYRCFEGLILLSLLVAAWGRRRLRETDLLLVLFAIHVGLYAARNIPLAAMMIGYATARPWAEAMAQVRDPGKHPQGLAALLEAVHGASESATAMERSFRGHAAALVVVLALAGIAVHGGRLFSTPVMAAHFSEEQFPVKAAEFIAAQGIRDGIFDPDNWSGYLIYRLYPGTRFFFDDRHDFYGEAYVRDYVKIRGADWQWRELLEKYRIRWVLAPPTMPLAAVLKESPDWRLEYDDGVALVFAKRSP